MSVIVVQVFVSLMLVAGSIVLFAFTVRQRDLEHADRLALTPLAEDTKPGTTSAASGFPEQPPEDPCTPSASNTTTP